MIKNPVSFTKALALSLFSAFTFNANAQQTKQKIDGVLGVVGDLIILDSDIDKAYFEIANQNIPIKDISKCQIINKLLEEKVFAHQAVQDSIVVTDAEVAGDLNRQLENMVQQAGSMDAIVKFYKKKDAEDLKQALSELIKENKLAEQMRDKIIDGVEITPEEVRQFYYKIPKDSLPQFSAEIEIAQIVIKPKVSDEAVQDVIQRLKDIRQEVLDGGSFFSKAVLYTEDPGSKNTGGYYKINRKTPFVKEFKDVAFSLKEGEISQPFKTDHGYHIIYLEKVKGQDLEVRHILMTPKISMSAEIEAQERAEKVRNEILSNQITFEEAAKKYSDEKETKNNGGRLVNPRTLETSFDLTKIDPLLYSKVEDLNENQISSIYTERDQQGKEELKIYTVLKKIPEHLADFSTDYMKIKNLALNKKQAEAINKWMKETVEKTHIFISQDYRNCDFQQNWLKK